MVVVAAVAAVVVVVAVSVIVVVVEGTDDGFAVGDHPPRLNLQEEDKCMRSALGAVVVVVEMDWLELRKLS